MGLTKPRAAQIYNLDYKQSTRVVTVTNITLSGGAPSLVDGVTLSLNDRILVTGQSTGSQNGLYLVTTVGSGSNGTWARTTDANETGEIEAGMIIMVTEGTIYADTQWKLTTNDPITIGTTALTFVQNYSANSITSGNSNVTVLTNANILLSSAGTANVVDVFGTGIKITGTQSVTGNITAGNANIIGTTASTSRTTGALTVAGGIGVAGDLYAGNSVTVDGGAYGNVVITQFASMYATANGSNPYSIMQVRSNDGTTGMGMRAYTGLNGQIYSNSGITFTTGATIKDKDFPTGGTTRATFDANGLAVTGIVSASGNVTGANIFTAGVVSATGNVTGNYFLGNVFFANGITASKIYNGNSEVNVTASGGNVNVSVGGTSNIALFTTTGEYITGVMSASGNVTGGNVLTAGVISATANVTGGNVLTAGLVSATANVTGGNILTAGLISATSTITAAANITGGNILTAGVMSSTGNAIHGNVLTAGGVSATANVTGGNILTAGLVSATSTITSASNITGGNILTAGLISATGNITGNYFLGNVACASGIYASRIFNGNSEANIGTANGNANISIGGTSNVVVVTTTGVLVTGITSASGNVTGGNVLTAGLVTATGNVTGGNIRTAGLVTATGNVTGGNILTAGIVSATGNITANNFIGNGNALTGINSFSTVAVTGQSNIVASGLNSAVTFTAGNNISLTTGANTITIAYSASGSSSIFATGGDMGLISQPVTASEDLGNLSLADLSYDLGSLFTVTTVNQLDVTGFTGNVNAGNVNVTGNLYQNGNAYATLIQVITYGLAF